ncbi:hypothetical protein ACIHFE_14685 [Streptomyces sp. NPDC052396]|uniref:SCO3933 family regulatory protein n=1 Tax=Streptomyces sp. NPDC052396 TaxID=3365689 RepID=UPI0037D611FB
MARFRVGSTDSTRHMVGTGPVPKYTDQEKTTLATDRETGQTLYTLTVFLMEEERAEALKITVPKDGLPNGLMPGMQVRPVDLFATPWANIFNGQLQQGVAYRAAALELVTAPPVAVESGDLAA